MADASMEQTGLKLKITVAGRLIENHKNVFVPQNAGRIKGTLNSLFIASRSYNPDCFKGL
jgi:hypothetical protein